MRSLIALTLFAALSVDIQAQTPVRDERILLPLYVEPTPGLNSSLWISELWVHNANDTHAPIFPVPIGGYLGLPPRTSIKPPVEAQPVGYQPGSFIYVRDTHSARLHFSLRIRDVSRQAENLGTEIPVVREAELRSGRLSLVNVPLGEGLRQMLRIYQARNRGDALGQVRIRFFRMREIPTPDDAPFREEVVTLDGPSFHDLGYAQLSHFGAPFGLSAVRIEIEPITPGLMYWALVTVINNETQLLTTVTPQ